MSTQDPIPSCPKLSAILSSIAEEAGGEIASEFRELVELASMGATVNSAFEVFQKSLRKQNTEGTRPSSAEPRSRGQPRKTSSTTDPDQRLGVQLDLLRAEAKGEKDLASAVYAACQRLGLEETAANRLRVVGTLRARTHGRHRPNFLSRIVAAKGEKILSELARLYEKIEGKKVTVAQLRKEARKA